MKLASAFYKLPIRFDPDRLAAETDLFAESEWKAHPQGYAGNSAVSLVAVGGNAASDAVKGPMQPTQFLGRCPYIRQVLAALDCPIGRTRLMRIAGQGEAHAHVDTNYYWMQRVRVHIPVRTYPGVRFQCGDREVFMAAGECWLFDTWRLHNVLNPDDRPRIHLVVDTVGSAGFWDLVALADLADGQDPAKKVEPRFLPYDPTGRPEILLETSNYPVVMTPWEIECQLASFFEDLAGAPDVDAGLVSAVENRLARFHRQWRALWACFGDAEPGWPAYRRELDRLEAALKPFDGRLTLPNSIGLIEAVRQGVARVALNPELVRPGGPSSSATPPAAGGATITEHPGAASTYPALPAKKSAEVTTDQPVAPVDPSRPEVGRFDRPVFVVAAPRSGSSLLFETLARSPGFVTVGGESHEVIEGIAELTPQRHDYASNRLTEADATPEVAARLRAAFWKRLRDREGKPPAPGSAVRMLEKTPKNALRVPFLRAVFPDALFIYLYREPRENLSSIIEAWKSGKFVTYRKLPGWGGAPWSLLLTPGWRDLRRKGLAEVAASQWSEAHRHILDDLTAGPAERWLGVTYDELLEDPQRTVERLCEFAGVPWDQQLQGPLPLSQHTLTPPDRDKWKKNAAEIEKVLPSVAPLADRVWRAIASSQNLAPAARAGAAAAFRAVSTSNLTEVLQELGLSLVVTTYQAGKIFLVRSDGPQLNNHFRALPVPMGMALGRKGLAVGTKHHIWLFQDMPRVARKLEPAGKHDVCFLPRWTHFTGDIRVHEMAWAGDELCIVNTRFSCLCTIDDEFSFVPTWRPPFVTALAAEDRCHLNGLCLVDGEPRYVTALGVTDTPGGWRENKRSGGVLIDVPSGEVVLRGLSMPHSPRWHDNRLWLLESGEGSLAVADVATGRWEKVAEVPGFTRGLDFVGPFAFIGLSQIRETATFSGLPITERLKERCCGVWVVDTRSGKTIAFLRFEEGVQEIFAVQALAGRFPELLTEDDELMGNSFVLPEEALKHVPGATGQAS